MHGPGPWQSHSKKRKKKTCRADERDEREWVSYDVWSRQENTFFFLPVVPHRGVAKHHVTAIDLVHVRLAVAHIHS